MAGWCCVAPLSALWSPFSGTSLVTPSLRSLVSRRLSDEGQEAALGSLQALQSLGSFLGPPLAGLAYDLLGRTSPFFGSAGLLVIVVLLVTRSPLEHTTG